MTSAVRRSGQTAEEEVIAEIQATADDEVTAELPEERERSFRFPGFSRMRFDWYGEDGMVMAQAHAAVDDLIDRLFRDLLKVRQELYDVVRFPVRDSRGNPEVDRYGWMIWQTDEDGDYLEDWDQLTHHQQKRFLFLITTRLFDWEQARDRMWAESMMAKTQWEEAFATGWQDAKGTGRAPTDGDKTAEGRRQSQEERYFAIYRTYLSRRADSLVRGMDRLCQRLKDVHTA